MAITIVERLIGDLTKDVDCFQRGLGVAKVPQNGLGVNVITVFITPQTVLRSRSKEVVIYRGFAAFVFHLVHFINGNQTRGKSKIYFYYCIWLF